MVTTINTTLVINENYEGILRISLHFMPSMKAMRMQNFPNLVEKAFQE